MRRCRECGALLNEETEICPECGWNPFIYQGEGFQIELLTDDGVRIPAPQLSYSYGDNLIIGELTYSHTRLREIINKKGEEEEIERELILPVLVWSTFIDGELKERRWRPYYIKRGENFTILFAGRPIIVEMRSRMAQTLETLMSLKAIRRFVEGLSLIHI